MQPASDDIIFLMLGRLSKAGYQLTELEDLEEEEFGDDGYE